MQICHGIKYFDAPPIYRLSDILRQGAQKYADRTALVFRERPSDQQLQKISYKQFAENAADLEQGLIAEGEQGGRVAIVGDNSYPWMLTYLAVVEGNSVLVPLDRLLPGEELASLLQRGEVTTFVLDASMVESLRPFIKACPGVQRWIVMQQQRLHKKEDLAAFSAEVEACGQTCLLFEDVLELGRSRRAAGQLVEMQSLDKDELAVLLFTSGTTSSSKAVMLSNANICADIRALLETVRFKDPLQSLSFLPLHHTFENTCGFLSVLSLGGCIHLYDGLRYISKNLKEYQVHMLISVPTVFELMYRKILQNAEKTVQLKKLKFGLKLSRGLMALGIDLRRKIFKSILDEMGGNFYIAISGAAALDKKIIDFFHDIGVDILQGYGMTETAPVVAGCNTQINVRGSCGFPLSGVTLAIDNEKDGEPGEILVKGDMVMLGYYQNDELNEECFSKDGWFHSGDIGRMDPETGALYLTGRTKSMIVLPSGKKVFPEEIETLLNQRPYVKESLLFEQADVNGDLVLSAKIVLDKEAMSQDGQPLDKSSIQRLLENTVKKTNEALPSFKGIRSYAYSFTEMLKTTTLKIKRGAEIQQLRDLLEKKKIGWRELIGRNLDQLEDENDGEEEEKDEIEGKE